eukprot:838645-Pyramimonas_sp.AAC.1
MRVGFGMAGRLPTGSDALGARFVTSSVPRGPGSSVSDRFRPSFSPFVASSGICRRLTCSLRTSGSTFLCMNVRLVRSGA